MNNFISQPIHLAILIASAVVGYFLTLLATKFLCWRRSKETAEDRQLIMKSATRQADQWENLELSRQKSEVERLNSDFEEDLEEMAEDLKNSEEDFQLREVFLEGEEKRIEEFAVKLEQRKKSLVEVKAKSEVIVAKSEAFKKDYYQKIEAATNLDVNKLAANVQDQLVEERKLGAQKNLNTIMTELDKQAKKRALRSINRILSRYSPNFYWPKLSNQVEVAQAQHAQKILREDDVELNLLKELAEIEIEAIQDSRNPNVVLKLAGGMGLKREAARLALLEITNNNMSKWNEVKDVFQSYEIKLRNYSLELGRKAVINLGIDNIHPEIQRMVGFLNWRTSYRQNQYLHTFEVAKLAGIVGQELGLDPQKAKRCGLMHDIGKSIDYRIEGGHALISGDYADRYGEAQEITDTVMSHHDELVLDTPLSFVLKTADTLSGARPGARVNLEEGYQMRLSDLNDAVRSFHGVTKISIMNGAREIHVEVDPVKVKDQHLRELSQEIAKKIEETVAYPGQIKVLITRRYESTAVA